jgi:integrase
MAESGASRSVEAQDGRDPIKEKRERKKLAEIEARTVGVAIDEYADLHLRPNLNTGDERERQLRSALAERLGMPIAALTKVDLQAAIDSKAQQGHGFAANRLRSALMAFTTWCWQRGYLAENVGAALSKSTKERPRDRVLSMSEVQAILQASHSLGPLWGPFLRVLIYTAQRRGEVAGMRWADVDLDARRWLIPARSTKNRRPHIVHLSDLVLAELTALRDAADPNCDLVFTTTGRTGISGFSRVKERLDKMIDLPGWRFHDLRTSFASALCERGEPENVVDRVLNHAASGSAPSAVARVYNQSELLEQRARALDLWAEMLAERNVRYEHRTI